ncbi:hypothetical protein [Sorangium sp. So ce124]|uniref:hypothetical protein n=1 Tax=Sorangium sp. So ce124 TaxID=3133280 RepID=UPI003F639776
MVPIRLPRASGARRIRVAAPTRTRAPLGRLAATILVATLATTGPVLEGALGDGRGWTIGLLVLLLAPSLARAGGPRFHPLDPETYVPATYFLSVAYSPILDLLTSRGFYLPSRAVAAMEAAYAGAVGCALACTALSRVQESPNTERLVPMRRPRAMLDEDWGTIAVGVLGLGLIAVWIASIGVERFFTTSYADNHLLEDGKGVLTAGWHLVRLAMVYCCLRIASARKAGVPVPTMVTLAGLSFFASFLLNTVIGRRGPLVWALLCMALSLHVYGIQIRRLWLVLGMVGIVFYGLFMEGARLATGSGVAAQLESATAYLDSINSPFEIRELQIVYSNLVTIVNDRPPLITYAGESWVNAFLILIPKPLWDGRPLSLAQRYAMWMDPEFARRGGGFAMNATAEGFLNSGLVGTAVEIAVFSGLFFMLPLTLSASRNTTLFIRASAVCLASFAYNQFRGELTSLLKIALSIGLAMLAGVVLTTCARYSRRALAAMRPWSHRPARSPRVLRLSQPPAQNR